MKYAKMVIEHHNGYVTERLEFSMEMPYDPGMEGMWRILMSHLTTPGVWKIMSFSYHEE